MANTISKINNNNNFNKCIEFSDPFRIYWNEYIYNITQILFYLTAICLNVAAIVDTSEVVDSALGLHKSSYALSFYNTNSNSTSIIPEIKIWNLMNGNQHSCTRKQVKLGLCDPFDNEIIYGNYILTLGYIITAIVFVPLCIKDLKENTNYQIFGFIILLSLSTYFCYTFINVLTIKTIIELKHVTLWGNTYSNMLGIIMFNFALVLAIPAWLHEKKNNVCVTKAIVQSTIISTTLYITVGILGAFAIPHVNVNMLSPMVSGAYGKGIQIAGTFFSFFIIGLDIPLFSVLTRYNLTHSGLCSVRTANWLVVYIPWSISWILYQGNSIGILLAWGGTLLTSIVAFILPLYISIKALKVSTDNGSVAVYGQYLTNKLSSNIQIKLLYILLIISICAVIVAIFGQIISNNDVQNYLNSSEYINSTETYFENTFNATMQYEGYTLKLIHNHYE